MNKGYDFIILNIISNYIPREIVTFDGRDPP